MDVSGTASLNNVQIIGNYASFKAGAISSTGSVNIYNGTIRYNSSPRCAGIYFGGYTSNAMLIIESNTIADNKETTCDEKMGSAIFAEANNNAKVILNSVTIQDNVSNGYGAVTIRGSALELKGNCNITKNKLASDSSKANLFIYSNALVNCSELNDNSQIGVAVYSRRSTKQITSSVAKKGCFTSDDSDYIVLANNDAVVLEEYIPLDNTQKVEIYKGRTLLTGAPRVGDTLTAKCGATQLSYRWYLVYAQQPAVFQPMLSRKK